MCNMKKVFLIFIALFTILLTSCRSINYDKLADLIDSDDYNYAYVNSKDGSIDKKIYSNYVKSVWNDITDTSDIHTSVTRLAFSCDENYEFQIKMKVVDDKNFKIDSVTETYFYNFNYKDEKTRTIDYEIKDGYVYIDVTYNEYDDIHVYQYYKINFIIDKTHFGFFYFSIGYGNPITKFSNVCKFLKGINSDYIDYINIRGYDENNVLKYSNNNIDNSTVFNTILNFLDSVYLIKTNIDINNDKLAKVIIDLKLKNGEKTYNLMINSKLMFSYDDSNYYFETTNEFIKNTIYSFIK